MLGCLVCLVLGAWCAWCLVCLGASRSVLSHERRYYSQAAGRTANDIFQEYANFIEPQAPEWPQMVQDARERRNQKDNIKRRKPPAAFSVDPSCAGKSQLRET
jgi:hypothetical protein